MQSKLNVEMQTRMERNKVRARKILLNKSDILSFSNVPPFIINAFFGKWSYKSQLTVTTFAFVNGISEYQLFSLIKWKPFTKTDQLKIINFFHWLENPINSHKYFSYNVALSTVVYCNGDIRKYGVRKPNS